MKLNHDCVRDLLLYIEDNSSYNTKITLNNISLSNYSKEDIIYTADKLIEADYLNCMRSACFDNELPVIIVKSITYSGHQFLDTIRDDGIWKDTKNKISKFTSVSLPVIYELASSLLKSKLGLP